MRFSIKRKSNFFNKTALRSALLFVSAFAVYSPIFANPNDEYTSSTEARHGLTARWVFEKLNSSAIEILKPTTRLDMLDYWDVDSVYKASNAMEGLSWIEMLTPGYLKLHVTPVSTFEIKILPLKKEEEVVMTVYTVGDNSQAKDSDVKFYNMNLEILPQDKFFRMPPVKDFFEIPKGSATKMKEIEDMIPFPTMALNANPDNNNLEARLTVEQYINEDDWNIAKLFVKPYVVLEWKKDKYQVVRK